MSADFGKHLEATYILDVPYNENSREWIEITRAGENYGEGTQWLAYYDKNDKDSMGMVDSATFLFAFSEDQQETENEEGSSSEGVESVYRWIEDMWMEDAAGSLTYAAASAVAVSAFLLH